MAREQDLYKLLGVPRDADTEQINVAMAQLSKKYATRTRLDEATALRFNQIKAAYQVLSSPYRRAAYDISLEEEELNGKESRYFPTQFLTKWKERARTPFDDEDVDDPVAKEKPLNHASYDYKIDVTAHLQTVWTHLRAKEQQVKAKLLARRQKIQQTLEETMLPGEFIRYHAEIHWFFYVEIGALVLISIPGFLLLTTPILLEEAMPAVPFWVATRFLKSWQEFSVWSLGLLTLLFIGILVEIEVIIIKQTTELVITSRRIITQSGLFHRKWVELKLTSFESITIEQSLFGRFFDYGNLIIRGNGGVKTSVPHVIAPLKLKQTLWRILESDN